MGEHFERDFKVHSSVITSFSSISVVSKIGKLIQGRLPLTYGISLLFLLKRTSEAKQRARGEK